MSPSAQNLPIVVMNSTSDPIVSQEQTHGVMNGLREAGLHHARLVSYDGGHDLPLAETVSEIESLFSGAGG